MQFKKNQVHPVKRSGSIFSGIQQRQIRGLALACVAVAFALGGAAQAVPPPTPSSAPPGSPDRPYLLPEANNLPDLNTQMKMRDGLTKQQNFTAANAERRKQIADDSARLLKMATDLKAEVDKTTKDTLSLAVIRKADEIERLAHIVKEKMKLTVGTN
jgi:hypothetical protein